MVKGLHSLPVSIAYLVTTQWHLRSIQAYLKCKFYADPKIYPCHLASQHMVAGAEEADDGG